MLMILGGQIGFSWMVMIPDVVRIVIKYVEVRNLFGFFMMHDLDVCMSFKFDVLDCDLTGFELCELCELFPNVVLGRVGVCGRINVRRMRRKFVGRGRMKIRCLKMKTWSRYVDKTLAWLGGSGLVELNLSGCRRINDVVLGGLCFSCWRFSRVPLEK